MEYTGKKSVDKVRTTIGVRLATKYLLLDNSLPGESFEDTILRIIHERNDLSKENSRLVEILEKNNVKIPNVIKISRGERELNLIELSDGSTIHFSYNLPANDLDKNSDYTMDIMVEYVIIDGKKVSFSDLSLSHKDSIILMMKMVEKVINLNFDKGFELPEKTFLIDPLYWKKVYSRVGLGDSSYLNDIMKLVQEYESGPDG
jgi:hypothetical protein